MFSVIRKEQAANRQTPGCYGGAGKFSKAAGSGASPRLDLAFPESVAANFQQIFKLQPQMLFFFFSSLAAETIAGTGTM